MEGYCILSQRMATAERDVVRNAAVLYVDCLDVITQ